MRTADQESFLQSLGAYFDAFNNADARVEQASHSQDATVAALQDSVANLQADNAAKQSQITVLTAAAEQNAIDRDNARAERDAAISERDSLRERINTFLATFGLSLP